MRRILLHPGFHKTGTSSIQHFLWANRAALAPALRPVMLRHLKPVNRACCRYSRSLNPVELIDIAADMDAALAAAEVDAKCDILVSCEGLAGHLPGFPKVADYEAATLSIGTVAAFLQDRFPDAALQILLTTRDPDGWLWSAWRHHLQGRRMTEGFDAFAARIRPAADLDAMAARIAEAVAPLPVATLPLAEAKAHPQGPGGALLARAGLGPAVIARLDAVGVANAGPDDAVWEEFLTLNRSRLSDAAVKARKEALIKAHKLGGWRRL